jgi:hypothetical protein
MPLLSESMDWANLDLPAAVAGPRPCPRDLTGRAVASFPRNEADVNPDINLLLALRRSRQMACSSDGLIVAPPFASAITSRAASLAALASVIVMTGRPTDAIYAAGLYAHRQSRARS